MVSYGHGSPLTMHACCRPLLEYGLADGDVLELVPWEPTIKASPTQTSPQIVPDVPELSSPTHTLYNAWQRAASGLRAGALPDCANMATPQNTTRDRLVACTSRPSS